jgi:hypothetical protein
MHSILTTSRWRGSPWGSEVARYMQHHAGAPVVRVAFVSAITPFLRHQNPSGVNGAIFDRCFDRIEADRFDFVAPTASG